MQLQFERAEAKNFPIAPQVSIKSHFLVIDTKILYHLTRNAKLHQENEASFWTKRTQYWNEYFNLKGLKSKRRFQFANYLETDGVALCVHYKSREGEPDTDPSENENDEGESEELLEDSTIVNQESSSHSSSQHYHFPIPLIQRVIAFDPGRSTILHGVEQLPDGSIKEHILSQGRYYQESHIKRANRKTQRWNRKIQSTLDQLSETRRRTPDPTKLLEYLQIYNQNRGILWSHLTHKKYAQNRFDVYIHRHQCLDRFFNSLWQEGEQKPIIAYGNAKFAPTGRGEVAIPTTFVAKKCQDHYETVPVDEFRTTQRCHDCGDVLHKMYHDTLKKIKMKKGEGGKSIRGLRWCGSTRCLKLKNRDKNAALNILRIVRSEERPEWLRRECQGKGS
jgi:hypothetical protein